MVASLSLFAKTCKQASATHPHPRTCISSHKRWMAEMRRLDSAQSIDFFCGMIFSNVLPRNPYDRTFQHELTRRAGGSATRSHPNYDLHCGSCSASTQFSIHNLPPLWSKTPHAPNSKTTQQCPN